MQLSKIEQFKEANLDPRKNFTELKYESRVLHEMSYTKAQKVISF